MARNLTTGLQRGLRRSIAGGLGASDLFSVASLDLRFAQQKTLDPRITFTRASSGTYVGSDGLIKTATTNLLLRSEEFDNAAWTKFDGPTVTANQITAPNGTITADQIVGNGAATGYLEQAIPITNGLSYVFSIYLKKRTASTVNTLLYGSQFNSGGGNQVATWNLDTGTASFTNGATGSMTAVGDGWFRCVMRSTATTTNASSANQLIRLVGNSGDAYIWGAQLEQSSTVGEYIPTTSTINSAPRFDHNPTTGESLGLLVEEQRTNLVQQSADISNVYWVKAETTVTANAITAPDGTTTAGKLVESTNNSQHTLASAAISWAGNTQYTATFFAKAGERSKFDILLGTGANWVNTERVAQFDLVAGTVNAPPGSPAIASITPLPNNWYRCRLTATTVASPSASAVFIRMCDDAGLSSYTGISGRGLYLWGVQLEAGSFPTSYIPTTTATVTRSADVASITGANFSSWYNQTEGTVFAQGQRYANDPYYRLLSFNSGSGSNILAIYTDNGPRYSGLKKVNNGADNYFLGPNVSTLASNLKTCLASNGSSSVIATSGTVGTEASIAGMPTVDRLSIGAEWYGGYYNGIIRRLTYWPSRLPNATLQQITR